MAVHVQADNDRAFKDLFQFIDDVHGRILLNNLERDAVDSPEFQRLFRIAQLGLVEITYQTGDHSRGAHSIGTCHAAQRLLAALQQNQERGAFSVPTISPAEKILIRLGALLHDIPHGPFSHDIEKKKHLIKRPDGEAKIKSANGPFEKHDDYKVNPAFYIAVFDVQRSILARVLRAYSAQFWRCMAQDEPPEHLQQFLSIAKNWSGVEDEILPQLLFHLFAFEELADATEHSLEIVKTFDGKPEWWHLGPPELAKELHEAWYQPFRHEIIGNTLSADLIDYLARDCARLYINGGIDENLLRYYVLTQAPGTPIRYRCAIDLYDSKRGIVRSDRLNDIFQMLEVRHQIHEKAVYHRMAQSSLAMLSRAVTLGQEAEKHRELDGDAPPRRTGASEPLTIPSLYGFDTPTDSGNTRGDVAIRGDEHFLARLVNHEHAATKQLGRKLAERRLFRPLMIVPGHRTDRLMAESFRTTDKTRRENNLRELATIIDSPVFAPFFNVISSAIEGLLRHEFTSDGINATAGYDDGSVEAFLRHFVTNAAARLVPANHRVIYWTLPYKQLFKDPAIVVTTPGGIPRSLHEIIDLQPDAESENPEFTLIRDRVASGIADADIRYAQMWKIYVFLSDGLFYGGSMAKLISTSDDYSSGCADGGKRHAQHLKTAGTLAARAISAAWDYWDHRRDEHKHAASTEVFLKGEPSDHMMRNLIGNVLESDATGSGASEVSFEQYQHGEGETQSRCRDIRYRFEEAVPIPEDHALTPLLRALSCTRRFFPSELNELAATLGPCEELISAIQMASDRGSIDRLLRKRAFLARLQSAGFAAAPQEPAVVMPGGTLDIVEIRDVARTIPFVDDLTQARTLLNAAVRARSERRYEDASRHLEDLLRIPRNGETLTTLHVTGLLLRAEVGLDRLAGSRSTTQKQGRKKGAQTGEKSPYDRIDADVSAAAALEADVSDVQRLRGIIAWRKRADALNAQSIPDVIAKRGEQESLENQERFFSIAERVIKARPNVRERRLLAEQWHGIAKEAWEN